MKSLLSFFLISSFTLIHAVEYVPGSRSDSLNIMTLDLLIPGYGAYSQKRYREGTLWAVSKLAGAGLIYTSFQSYRYWDSLANSAYQAQKNSPYELYFEPPHRNDDPLSYDEIRNRAERYYTATLMAASLEIAIYGFSLWRTHHLLSQKQKKVTSFYRLSPDDSKFEAGIVLH